MSSYTESRIFNHIIKYFEKYSKFTIIQTLKPINNADIYYYFRPHLEIKLQENSIVTVHHDLHEKDKNLQINKFISRYKEAKLVVCLNSIQKNILENYGVDHTIIIPHGYNDLVLKPYKKKNNQKLVFGFFSNYYPRLVKGETYLLELMKSVSTENFSFILVGKNRKFLAEDLNSYGFDCVVYEDLPYNAFNKLYQKIDCLLITSEFEGGPASLPEALATDTFVLTTKVGMANDLIENENILFLTKDKQEDISTINSLRTNIKQDSNRLVHQNLLTWKEVILLYDEQFITATSFREKEFAVSYYKDSLSYKYHTFYLKNKIKSFFLREINRIKLSIS